MQKLLGMKSKQFCIVWFQWLWNINGSYWDAFSIYVIKNVNDYKIPFNFTNYKHVLISIKHWTKLSVIISL